MNVRYAILQSCEITNPLINKLRKILKFSILYLPKDTLLVKCVATALLDNNHFLFKRTPYFPQSYVVKDNIRGISFRCQINWTMAKAQEMNPSIEKKPHCKQPEYEQMTALLYEHQGQNLKWARPAFHLLLCVHSGEALINHSPVGWTYRGPLRLAPGSLTKHSVWERA